MRLEPFDRDATEAYIKHRLRLAGADKMLFTSAAIDIVHAQADGIPRVINTLCDNALFEAFLARDDIVGEQLMARIGDSLRLTTSAVRESAAPTKSAGRTRSVGRRRKLDMSAIDQMLSGLQK